MTDRLNDFLTRAATRPVQLRISDLLVIWGVRARTYENVAQIRRDLSAAGLTCEPDLAEGSADATVQVGMPVTSPVDTDRPDETRVDAEEQDAPLQLPPAALLVKHIPSATRYVERVSPDQTLEQAQAIMTAHDYSQLAVMSSDRDLKGAVSWRSIARAYLVKPEISLADAIKRPAPEVRADADLLSQIDLIWQEDFVFVRDGDDRICGIVTTADLTGQFRDLTTPYFQLGEIERRLRRCIDRALSTDELRAVTGKDSAEEMVFGQYVRLLNDEVRWRQMGWGRLDRTMFIGYLDDARVVHNRVMHFGRELEPEDKHKLEQCLNFMRALDPQQ